MSTISKTHYIGITGFLSDDDIDTARRCVALMPRGLRLMAGVLVSAKTLRGESPARKRYPFFSEAQKLLGQLEACSAWPVVHFNTRSTGDQFRSELETLYERLPAMRGIQLNVVRPDFAAMHGFKDIHPEIEIILQVNGSSLASGPRAEAIRTYIKKYEDVATFALLDLSGGRGIPLDINLARELLRTWDSGLIPSVAGGLDAEAVTVLRGLRVSCDAETKLRTSDDLLDPDLAFNYVRAATDAWLAEPNPSWYAAI